MKIYGIYNISNNDGVKFYKQIADTITFLQNDDQIVEVQYSTNVDKCIDGGIVYSALILGRK